MDESLKKTLRKLDEVLGLLEEQIHEEKESAQKVQQEMGADDS